MKLIIQISLDNAAFADDGAPAEIDRLLNYVADLIHFHGIGPGLIALAEQNQDGEIIPLRDYNGNRVGAARLIETEDNDQ